VNHTIRRRRVITLTKNRKRKTVWRTTLIRDGRPTSYTDEPVRGDSAASYRAAFEQGAALHPAGAQSGLGFLGLCGSRPVLPSRAGLLRGAGGARAGAAGSRALGKLSRPCASLDPAVLERAHRARMRLPAHPSGPRRPLLIPRAGSGSLGFTWNTCSYVKYFPLPRPPKSIPGV
jgi:hypothetical protein